MPPPFPGPVFAGPVVALQEWVDVAFVHWACPPEAVAPILPEGLELDLWDGEAWLTITPFVARASRPRPLPTALALPPYGEVNLRTYVRNRAGVPGVWFVSLDADSLPIVTSARALLGLPYRLASFACARDAATVTYRSATRGSPSFRQATTIRVGEPIEPDARDEFLTMRWCAHGRVAGVLTALPVRHERWPLHRAEVVALDETLTEAAGLPPAGGDVLAHWSPGVHVEFGPVRPRL